MTAISVEFHGINHNSLNLQAIPRIKDELTAQIEISSGKHIVLLEASGSTRSAAARLSKIDQELGFFRARVSTDFWHQTGRYPTSRELEDRIGQIHDLDLDTALKRGLIPRNIVHLTYLSKVWDGFRDAGLVSVYESHPQAAVEQNKRLSEQGQQYALTALSDLGLGNFNSAIHRWQQTYTSLVQGAYFRERGRGGEDKGVINLARTQVKTLKRDGGGSLFILFGDDHSPMFDQIKRPFISDPNIGLSLERHTSLQNPHVVIFQLLRERQVVPVELYVQDLFLNGAVHRLEKLASERGQISVYAANCETIHDTFGLVVRGLSLEEMREICEERTDIYSVVKNHPLAESIRGLLP